MTTPHPEHPMAAVERQAYRRNQAHRLLAIACVLALPTGALGGWAFGHLWIGLVAASAVCGLATVAQAWLLSFHNRAEALFLSSGVLAITVTAAWTFTAPRNAAAFAALFVVILAYATGMLLFGARDMRRIRQTTAEWQRVAEQLRDRS